MIRRYALFAVLFVALLIPGILSVIENADQPLLGFSHDDGIYWVTAKAIANGSGYRILNLPDQPYQTKYPPLFPAYLSLAWLLNPDFPSNLRIASWMQFLWLPLLLALSLWHWQHWGVTGWRRWLLAAVLATNAYVHFFSMALMSELPFTCLVLASLLLLERARDNRWIIAAALMAAAAFLTRTAGIALLVTVPAVLYLQAKRKQAALFAAVMAPFVLAWFASVVPFFVCSRYRLPITPLLPLFALLPVEEGWRRYREKRWASLRLNEARW